ncbi:flavin monoamine oxidase family protein [Glaciibacter psychrotolerans]|uniref:Phytoene dehydrogenase-like protein n=1 Tax=Glaciibacter psychrotolerans TaxID=670054 RepID=A0A7Z0EE54_9MICO|nr:NAD(P)/FAD-dependent oxidoreductase [Leifsonia psychrotolerans]NYJ19816.1 phytoene dehydrogenase-like protein [Leifsonia psychrotolerans]
MDTDVIVIGAGLAGLQCARRAERSGHSVIVLESEATIGGRVRTDSVDGFLCDRGFQLLNPAYPAVRDWIDVPALGLQKFGVGVVVRTGETSTTLAHPLRHPRFALETLRSELTPRSDLVALARWLGPTLLRPSRASHAARDQTLHESLDEAGLTGRFRRDVLDTFLAGVLADSTGTSSANYVRLLMRYFALGAPGLPRAGMQALPEQMAASLAEPVRLGAAARTVREAPGGIEVTTDHETIRGRIAVVAVGPADVAELTDLPAPATHGLTTWWFRATDRPQAQPPGVLSGGPFLMLDATRPGGGPAGSIWNAAVISDVAPSYAPPGETLVQATTLLDRPDGLAGEGDVRRDLERLYRTSTRHWEVLVHHVVPHALPAQPPPLGDRRPRWTGDRVLVTGDHRGTGSIQGALVAGDRAARAVIDLLAQL